jgi:hypothetical protein
MTTQQQGGEMPRTVFDKHECEALLIHCIDFRFWKALHNFVETTLGIHDYDLLSLAGGAKNFANPTEPFLFETTELNAVISKRLHHIKKIILTNHIDCGAYGGSSKFKNREEEVEFHKAELERAGKVAGEKFPHLEVIKILVSRREDDVDCLVLK